MRATRTAVWNRGRRQALGIVILIMGIEGLIALAFLVRFGPDAAIRPITRMGLAFVILHFLYRGAKWARWTLLVLLSLGVLVGVANLADPGIAQTWPLVILLVSYLLIIATLLFSRPLRIFMRAQRHRPVPAFGIL